MESIEVCREMVKTLERYADVGFRCVACGQSVFGAAAVEKVMNLGIIYDLGIRGGLLIVQIGFDTAGDGDIGELKRLAREYNDSAIYTCFEDIFPRDVEGGGDVFTQSGDFGERLTDMLDEVLINEPTAGIIRRMIAAV